MVRDGAIPSRRAGTDAAIVDAVVARNPARVLDAGCGEGWLVRALAARGIEADGFDAEPSLVEAARIASPERQFWVEEFGQGSAANATAAAYDAVVLNFALFGEDPAPILASLAGRLNPCGAILIQTIHPASEAGQSSGWRTESFEAFGPGGEAEGAAGWRPMPWYFHTLESWRHTAARAGLEIVSLAEPRHPETGKPLSLILTLEQQPHRAGTLRPADL